MSKSESSVETVLKTEAATVYRGDCLDVLPTLDAGVADAVITDPPYGLGFLGQNWDRGIPGVPFWKAALRALKPGGYLLAFGGTRTFHRLACAIEDAGFDVRDCINWLYGTGYPKGEGCLKPAWEPILLCRKPGPKVLPLGINECRVPLAQEGRASRDPVGRWPANVAHDGSGEVAEAFAAYGKRRSAGEYLKTPVGIGYMGGARGGVGAMYADAGTAARFFYCAKASKKERGPGNDHRTVKPLALMEWLVRLVTPPGGTVLDLFLGSGATGLACVRTGRKIIGVEMLKEYAELSAERLRRDGVIPHDDDPDQSATN